MIFISYFKILIVNNINYKSDIILGERENKLSGRIRIFTYLINNRWGVTVRWVEYLSDVCGVVGSTPSPIIKKYVVKKGHIIIKSKHVVCAFSKNSQEFSCIVSGVFMINRRKGIKSPRL